MPQSKTVSFSKHAVNVFFHILTGCNLSCSHCYINPKQHGERMVPLAALKRWLQAFSGKSRFAQAVFLGGEPTLHPDLAEAARTAKDMGFESVTVDTNGYLFHDILDRVSPGIVDYFSFSLDGASRETNDAIRGEGVFDTCARNIPRTRARGFPVSLIYTVSTTNIRELHRMPALLSDWGVDRFFIQVIGIRGKSARQGSSLQVSREDWLEQVPEAAHRAAELGITATYPKVFLSPGEPFECAGICADNYFIFPNGRVYRCPLCEDFPLHAFRFSEDRLTPMPQINETDLFSLSIPEGCVMNRLIQPDTLRYDGNGRPLFRIACCMLKEEIHRD